MNSIQSEAVAIVHAGLADVLTWLGETPTTEHQPRHVAPPVTFEIKRMCDAHSRTITVGSAA